jgi:hypothetical protein
MIVIAKCCDVCGDGDDNFRSVFLASKGAGVSEASTAVDRKSMGHTVGDRSRTKPFFCLFPVFSVAVMGKGFDACGDREYYLRSSFSASEGVGISEASIAVDWKSIGLTVANRSSNEADCLCIFLCFPFLLHCCYGKVL